MMKLKSILCSMLGYGLFFGIILFIIFVLACFGGVVMHFFGFSYDSVGKLMLFFILSGLVGFPLEVLAKGLPQVLLACNRVSVGFAKVLFLILDVLSTMVSMTMIDHFMESVSATRKSIFVIAFILAITSIKDIGTPTKEDADKEEL